MSGQVGVVDGTKMAGLHRPLIPDQDIFWRADAAASIMTSYFDLIHRTRRGNLALRGVDNEQVTRKVVGKGPASDRRTCYRRRNSEVPCQQQATRGMPQQVRCFVHGRAVVESQFGVCLVNGELFTKPVVVVTLASRDDITDGWAVLERPSLTRGDGVTFITGFHSAESAASVRGRRVLIPIHSVTSITEYDTVAEVWEKPKPKRKGRK